MKRIYAIISLWCLICLFAMAQDNAHIRFMGVELGGTIAEMQTRLEAKGIKISPMNSSLPTGQRAFEGVFSGEKYFPEIRIIKIFFTYSATVCQSAVLRRPKRRS